MKRLILKSYQSPGDVVMLTAAVRDLHVACPGQFQTDVRTSAPDLWRNNPHITPMCEREPGVQVLEMHYPLIHESNQRPYHFIHGYPQFLESQLGVRIPLTQFHGDIHLSSEEKKDPPPGRELGVPDRFWILIAGGKYDFTAKWWNPELFQALVDHFQGQITFVQCGEDGHWHLPLRGVVNLIGKTTMRQFVRLMYHADGVVCPVTLAMHLAAAVETKEGGRGSRPCVVVAGGREPAHWEAYPQHQVLSTNGALDCCRNGGCWKSRCQLVGDGDDKDSRDLCEQPVQVRPDLRIPRCMEMIRPQDVCRRIELYYEGGALPKSNGHRGNGQATPPPPSIQSPAPVEKQATSRKTISVSFHHGLGDCAYFAHLIPLYTKRGYPVEVECTPDKQVLFRAAGAKIVAKAATSHPWGYPSGGTFEGQGRFWQGSKIGHNLSHPPLPDIGCKEELWEEFCATRIEIGPHLAPETLETVRRWIERLPRPLTLLHTKGNSGQERKSLPDEIAAAFYKSFLDRCDGTLLLLDWDNRVPRMASYRIRHLDELGPCSTETLLALIDQADLLVGVDSGPLHVSRFTTTPTVGVWMPGHYPTTYTLPRNEQLNVVLADQGRQWNRLKRIPWNIWEHSGSTYKADALAEVCAAMLGNAKYLDRGQIAADVQLQQFVSQWCCGIHGNALSGYCDRNRSFDFLLGEASARFNQPTIVETGTIRAEEDWAGAGFSTFLLGAYVHRRDGKLHSVDLSPQNCQFARKWTAVFGTAVEIAQQDSVAFLGSFPTAIDVLYLDSLDTTEPAHADHCLREIQAAQPRLHEQSLVAIDDTPWHGGAWVGKGALAVPWLIKQGWSVLYGGYQVVLSRQPSIRK